jgi:hypothetical protein
MRLESAVNAGVGKIIDRRSVGLLSEEGAEHALFGGHEKFPVGLEQATGNVITQNNTR